MPTSVLLTCHGTVDRVEDLPAFLANIRRGRPTPAAVIEELSRRYRRIGGSPLRRITAEQAAALSAKVGMPVRFAGRLWAPYPADVVAEMAREGATRLVSLPLAPQSVEIYHADVRAAAAAAGVEVLAAPPWGREEALIDAFVESVDEGLARFPADERAGVAVVLSAHSLPQRVVDAGDTYEVEFRAAAADVAARIAPRGNPVRVAFQSQGMDGGAWIGPDLPATFAALAAEGVRSALVAPIGFVADHVETLYDLDVEAPELARRAGLSRLERAPAMNARPRFVAWQQFCEQAWNVPQASALAAARGAEGWELVAMYNGVLCYKRAAGPPAPPRAPMVSAPPSGTQGSVPIVRDPGF